VKIATWNVNSVTARLPLVLRWLEEARPDVLCLQEVKCTDERFPATEFAAAGYASAVNGQPTYNGVAILSRHGLEDVRRGMTGDEEGAQARVLSATVKGVKVVNVYVPNGQSVGSDKYKFKLEWLSRLRAYLDEEFWADDEVLICGDFNVAPEDRDVHDPALWREKILCSTPERAAIEEVRGWGFTDAFRLHNPGGGNFSWWDYRSGSFRRNTGLRIDHVWVSESLAARCRRSWIDKQPRGWERPSDHTPVVAEFTKV
jgi:exodeoxyribonuclease-3